jgi:hypothetical protein
VRLGLAGGELAPVTVSTAQMVHAAHNMVIVYVLEYGATAAIRAANVAQALLSAVQTYASPAIALGR